MSNNAETKMKMNFCWQCGFVTANDDDVLSHGSEHGQVEEIQPWTIIAHGDSYYNDRWAKTVGENYFNIEHDLSDEMMLKSWIGLATQHPDVAVHVLYRGVQVFDGSQKTYPMNCLPIIKPFYDKVLAAVKDAEDSKNRKEAEKKEQEDLARQVAKEKADLQLLASLKKKYPNG
jgi:hypothetical protein